MIIPQLHDNLHPFCYFPFAAVKPCTSRCSLRAIFLQLLFLLVWAAPCPAPASRQLTVSQTGEGDFATLGAALDSLPMYNYERLVIFVRNGVYEEKIRITQDYVTLRGEDRTKTIIRFQLPREQWQQNQDAIGPAVVNLCADDIILENLTIENTQPATGVHAFAVYGTDVTRTIIQDCNVWSRGGDTVSLWNYKEGMYYHARCDFRGGVDFVCPRGWCYVADSTFFETGGSAALWHAGGHDRDQKFVLRNCAFDGAQPFDLGRHHYEAQFYLLDCRFSEKVQNRPLYRVTYPDNPARERPFNWGERYYFHQCRRDGGDFDWMRDNLQTAPGAPRAERITPAWTFDGKWDPEKKEVPLLLRRRDAGAGRVALEFDEIVTVRGEPLLLLPGGESLDYERGGGSNTLTFVCGGPSVPQKIPRDTKVLGGRLIGTLATAQERPVEFGARPRTPQSTTQSFPLWPDGVPEQLANAGAEQAADGRVSNVHNPELIAYLLPARNSRAGRPAVIVCPGGGYQRLAIEKEGRAIARWLNDLGISALVLKYRHAPYQAPIPQLDARRAIRLARAHAAEWNVDPRRIGIMGYSAGGHLASTALTLFDDAELSARETRLAIPDAASSCRPDFGILAYPVIVMNDDKLTHSGSRENLLGKQFTPEQARAFSTNLRVTARTPPVFLFHARDDRSVPVENSILFHEALQAAGVSAQLQLSAHGGHGFGLRVGEAYWACERWLLHQGLMQ